MYVLTSDEEIRALNEKVIGGGCTIYSGVPHAYLVIDQSFFGDDRMGSYQPVLVSSSVNEAWRDIVATSIVAQNYLASRTPDFHQQAVNLELRLVGERFGAEALDEYIRWRIQAIEAALDRLALWGLEPLIKFSWLASLKGLQQIIDRQ